MIVLSNALQTAKHAVLGDYFNEIIKLLSMVDSGRKQNLE